MHRMIQAGEGPRIVIKISRQFSGMGHEKKNTPSDCHLPSTKVKKTERLAIMIVGSAVLKYFQYNNHFTLPIILSSASSVRSTLSPFI